MGTYVHSDLCFTPVMTSNTAPAPNVVTASSQAFTAAAPWKAFEQVVTEGGNAWETNSTQTGWIKFDLGAGNTEQAASYTISDGAYSGYLNRDPKTWTLQGSNNDVDWDVLDTQTDVPVWTSREMREYTVVPLAYYRYYKLDVTANQGGTHLTIGEIELLSTNTINADVIIPSMTAEGFTGIDARDVTNPSMTAEGFTGIYSAPSIPMIRAAGTLSDNLTRINSDITIPMMTAAITQAKQIWGAVTVPMMTASLTERETVLGNVEIPMMTAKLGSGLHANLDASVPMMTAEGLFSGQCKATVPMMTVEMEGKVGRVGNISVTIPMMTVSVTGKTEHLGNISVTVPMMRALAELITGKVMTGAATVPMMTAALSSYEDITGDINATLPMIEPYMIGTTERATCQVLRYIEPI